MSDYQTRTRQARAESCQDVFSGPRLQACAALMEQYADTPMDFADATLVVLAGHFAADDILTLDERGFRTYRFARNRPFRLLLQDGGPSPRTRRTG